MLTITEVRERLARACRDAGSARAWAWSNGLNEATVSMTLNGHRDPSPAILDALGLREVTLYTPKEPADG